VEHFITKDGFTESRKARAKVSDKNLSEHKFGIFNVAKDTVYFVDFSKLSGIQSLPKYYQDYENLKNKEEKPQQVIMQSPVYSDDARNAVMELRSMDNKHRWIVQLDLASGKITELDHQHDEAWIGGPGIPSYGFGNGTLGFINSNTIYFQSEVTGFSHLYTLDLNLKKKIALTSGNWEVRNAQLSNDKKSFYLTTTTTHPGNRSFYKLDITSQKMTGIFTNDGAYEVEIAPDEKSFLVRYSFKNKPWELFYAENKPNAKLQQITFSTTKEFQQYQWQAPEVVTFTAQDGKTSLRSIVRTKKRKQKQRCCHFCSWRGLFAKRA
jgi:dipeptidyl aminopeptidase/acylaminoacyl peptidase